MRSRFKLGLALAAIALSSCAPLVNFVSPQFPKGITATVQGNNWAVTADSSMSGFVIGSSRDIAEKYTSTAPCRWQTVTAGERRALACNAPNTVNFFTPGTPWVRTLEKAPIITLISYQLGPQVRSRSQVRFNQ